MTSLEEIHAVKDHAVVAMRAAGIERGVRNLLTQLYPDNAHFIYELLQNAEDAGATEVIFDLQPDRLVCKHDGRPFTIDDVESILSIGDTTKADDPTAIGKFGVGFKAVFSYCSTPEIRSGDYAFAIRDLIVPVPIQMGPTSSWTEFRFPFDNPSKPPTRAYAEIRQGLIDLDGSTVLFLTNVQSLMYVIPDEVDGLIERRVLDEDCVAVVREGPAGEGVDRWLRLTTDVEMPSQGGVATKRIPIAAAFRLVAPQSPETPAGEGSERDARDTERPYRVAPLEDADARVAIFFPAVKERSGLRFHIHSGFASTVARDSVTDSPDNVRLVDAIGALIASRLPELLRRGLLDDGMLEALPNSGDTLHARYASIRTAVIEAFHEYELTPVHGGRDRAFAHDLVSSPSSFRRALSVSDLNFLATLGLGPGGTSYRWVAERPGRAGAFLKSLNIREFGWSGLSKALGIVAGVWAANGEPRPTRANHATGELQAWLVWLETKNEKQLRRLYAFLGEAHEQRWPQMHLAELPVVRRYDRGKSEHVQGASTYLPASKSDKAAKRVPTSLAPFADDPTDKEANWLRTFYDAAGVRIWNETTRVFEALEKYRPGSFPDRGQNLKDLPLFRDYLAANPGQSAKFKNVQFLIGENGLGGTYWVRPTSLFLDTPYAETGLSHVYLAGLDETPAKYRLWAGYAQAVDGIAGFAETLGCTVGLKVASSNAVHNPEFEWAWRIGRETSLGSNRDWDLPEFDAVVAARDETLLRGLWDAVASLPRDRARAVYQCNGSTSAHWMPSTLAQRLQEAPWILDLDGNLRLPQAISEQELAPGLTAPADGGLLVEVGFGRDAAVDALQRGAADAVAIAAGLPSGDVMRLLGSLLAGKSEAEALELVSQFAATVEATWNVEGSPSQDPERRMRSAQDEAMEAPTRRYGVRERSVALDSGSQTAEAKAYLRGHYRRRDGRLACQACHLPMPFQVAGEDYFEAVHFLRSIKTVHHQNRLALCPVCAAKYKHAKETADDDLRRQLDSLTSSEAEMERDWVDLTVHLAGASHELRFASKHALELMGILIPAGKVGNLQGD